MPWHWRLGLVAAASALAGALAVAAWLRPSPTGMGTHRQLGLPRCTLVEWYGIRCPSCGMTTAWAHTVRGQWIRAWRASAGGTLLAAAAIAGVPWLLASGLTGRWVLGPPDERAVLTAALAIAGVTLVEWALRLSLG